MKKTKIDKPFEPSQSLRQWSMFFVTTVLIIGVLVLVGWSFNIDFLKYVVPGLVAMNPSTAVCFILSALSYYLLVNNSKNHRKRKMGTALSIMVLSIGILKLASLILNMDFPIDSLLFYEKLSGQVVDNVNNRMAPNTALEFVFTGFALLFLNKQAGKFRMPSQIIALFIGALGILSVLGYLYHVRAFYGFMSYIPMAIHTAVSFLLMALAILFTHPDKGLMAEFLGIQAGAIAARKLIPAAIIIPILLGFFKVYLTWKGFISEEMGITILVLGNMMIFLAVITLITRELNRKDALKIKAEKSLRDSLKDISDYKQALDESSILAITNQKGIIEKVNDNFCEISKYQRKELIGKDHRIINSGYHSKEFIKNLWVTIAQGKIWKGEIKNKAKDGTFYWVETTIVPFMNDEGKPYQYVAIRSDITKRKELEEKVNQFNRDLQKMVKEKSDELIEKDQQYRFLLQNMREGIQVIGHDWRYLFINNSIEEHSKYDKEELLGYTMMEKYPGIENTKLFSVLQTCMKERISKVVEDEFTFPDGAKRWFELSIQPVKEGLFILSMDIADRKKAEESLKEYAKDLENSNIELEHFAFVASHDLQEPLRMVSSFMELLGKKLDGQLDETNKKYIHFAVDGAKRMKALILDLLEYSRVGINKDKFVLTDLNEVMLYVNRILAKEINKKHAVINVNPLPVILGNKLLLNQLFINLVSNSLKYMENKVPLIEVGCIDQLGNWLFYIKDNGIGINPKYFDKIFVIFQRLHNKSDYSGTGIGLAICKKIVELHKGKIWVESEEGKGCIFYFTIPKTKNNS